MDDYLDIILLIASYTGVAVFAATGVLASLRRQMDMVGAVVLAIVTSIGGGTLRDVLTGQPVFWVREPIYLWIAVGTALVMLTFVGRIRFPERALLLPDAVGLALFTWLGCEKVAMLGHAGIVVVLCGVVTGVAGGLIRDVLSAQVPNIMRKGELYAFASLPGAVLFVILYDIKPLPEWVAPTATMLTVLIIRLAAIRWQLILPTLGEDPPFPGAAEAVLKGRAQLPDQTTPTHSESIPPRDP